MAEAKPEKKRTVKNPETFRERAVKAAAESDKPGRLRRTFKVLGRLIGQLLRPIGRLLAPVFRPIGKVLARLGRLRVVRLLGKILLIPYISSSWQELKQVTWPTWRNSLKLTWAVLVFAIIFGASVAVLDLGLDKVFKDVLLK